MDEQRVVVTGIGLLTALGGDDDATRQRLFAGSGGIRRLASLDPRGYRSQNAGEIEPAVVTAALAARGFRAGDRTTDLALLVSAEALEEAGLLPVAPGSPASETAVLFGTGSGPSHALQDSWQTYFEKGTRGLRPTTVPRCMVNVVSSQVSVQFGLHGSNYVVVSACSSSTAALGIGWRMIRHGYAERVLCGGSESMFTPGLYSSWDQLGVMSRAADPDRACRPFDLARDGFVLGEGAGALLLEARDAALARGARIRAEVLGYGESSDGTHITRPSVDGQAKAMARALQSAGLTPAAVDFVNAHGTATKANDTTEAEAIRQVFGPDTERTWVVSSKPFFGHLLGAAGVVETIAAIFCLEQGRLHGNPNLTDPDPSCAVHLAGTAAIALPARIALKNSFGFGGSNSTVILGRAEG
jgi:3-oxoacyl-[acyl-carrier-protein] synthase II